MEGKISEGFTIKTRLLSPSAEKMTDSWGNVFIPYWSSHRPIRDRNGVETCFAADEILDRSPEGGYNAILKLTILSTREEIKVRP